MMEDIKWCPQHGYPLPCDKCGMPLCKEGQREIYQEGFKAGQESEREFILQNTDRDKRARLEGIRKVVEWVNLKFKVDNDLEWQSQVKEWGL